MDELKSTLIQNKHPRMRRKNASVIDNFLKQTFANSFLTLMEQSQAQLSEKPSLKQSEEMIQTHYKKLHNIIDSIDQHLARRLQNHENQVFSIVKGQIETMREQTKLIVQKLNTAIKQKNIEDEIWQLSNELDYFKSQTYKLFQQNKKLREEMKILRSQIRENQIQLENSDKVMQKLKHDWMKAKVNKGKISKNLKKQIDGIQNSPLGKEMSLTSLQQKKQLKTDYSQLEPKAFKEVQSIGELPKQSVVNIHISNKQPLKKPITEIDSDPLSNDLNFDQSSFHRTISDNGLPKVHLIKVVSQLGQEIKSNVEFKVTRSKQVQTDPLKMTVNEFHQPQAQNVFSKTSCIDYAIAGNNERQIDLLKSGFYVRTFNGSKMGRLTSSKSKKESEKVRYMNNTFNKNKISNPKIQRERIRTTMNEFQTHRFK